MLDYKKLIERGHNWINNHFIPELNVPNGIIAEMSAAIETLLAEREATRWISTNDRQPCEEGLYLVAHESGYVTTFELTFKHNKFPRVFTHWIPLPAPPKND